jgi:hypothetical protein
MPSWLPDAILVTLLTVLGNVTISVLNRHKDPTDKRTGEANTAKILVDASGDLVERLQIRIDELSAELGKVRVENQMTINELQERVTLINRQYTDYILLTDDRIAELEQENKQIRQQNQELEGKTNLAQ